MRINTLSYESISDQLTCLNKVITKAGNFMLIPVRYLTNGSHILHDSKNITKNEKDEKSFIKTLLACIALVPGTIIGSALIGIGYANSSTIRNYHRDCQNLIETAEKIKQQVEQQFFDSTPRGLLNREQISSICRWRSVIQTNPSAATEILKIYDSAAIQFEDLNDWDQAFQIRYLAAKEKELFLSSHPLIDMKKAVSEQLKKMSNPIYGAHFSNMGATSLRGGNIRLSNRLIRDDPDKPAISTTCLDFRINRCSRNDLEKRMDFLIKNPDCLKKNTPTSLCEQVTIKTVPYLFRKYNKFSREYTKQDGYNPKITVHGETEAIQAYEIEFAGVGKIRFCKNLDCLSLCDHIVLELENTDPLQGKPVETMQHMLTFIGLGPILTPRTEIDEGVLKKMCFMRATDPAEAYKASNTRNFDLAYPLDSDLLSRMKKQEIFPGKTMWTAPFMSEQAKAKGEACGLITGITSLDRVDDMDIVYKTVTDLLKEGTISQLERLYAGVFVNGCSPGADLRSGGGNQVFTRLVTKKTVSKMNVPGRIRFLYSLEAINGITYGYSRDNFGSKENFYYSSRKNLPDLSAQINTESCSSNEIMIKERIDPKFIRGIQITTYGNNTEEVIEKWTAQLKEAGLVQENNGVATIFGKPINAFIHVQHVLKDGRFDVNWWD